MEQKQFADIFLLTNANKLPSDKVYLLKDKLSYMPEERQVSIQSLSLTDPMVILIISLLFGWLGLDRFMLGDIGLGILKLILNLLFIGMIWTVIDWFLTYKKTKERNFQKVMQVI
ncbi:TM2 domain-containing protein [Utexia brackfieldae]|uniref:TM2 domain-containing protein n=1 Tax=Utexia brackfieldae TaxID=3074108 RepID=UPI00370D3B47